MKATVRRTIAFLGAAVMATQFLGAATSSLPLGSSSIAFEQATPITPAQKEIERLLKQISANAVALSRHADTLESFTRGSKLQYETHAAALMRAKDAVNAMGADFRQLQALRAGALPWQQMTIDRLEPMLVGLANHTTAAIERLNAERGKLPTAGYQDAVLTLNAYAGAARNLIGVNLDYAEAREKLNRLDASPAEPAAKLSRESAASAQKAAKSLEQRVRTALLKLPYYGVFDHLAFQIDGDAVTLTGHASWPALQRDAERAVRAVEGVETVRNYIEVLPVSFTDDQLRLATYRAIYGQPTLARYRLNPHPPIRIIVKHGNVTLMGVVANEMDRTVANMQASRVPGTFSVTNNLQVGG